MAMTRSRLPSSARTTGARVPFFGREADVTEENLQARLRGLVLMSLANKTNALVLVPSSLEIEAEGSTQTVPTTGDPAAFRAVLGALLGTGAAEVSIRALRWHEPELTVEAG